MKWNWRKSRIIFLRENEHLFYLFIYLFIKQIILWEQKPRKHQSCKIEVWTDDKSIHALASLQFWRHYVTWSGAYTPQTYDSEVY